ncbi:hypothetical protein GMOD_00009646 [Pyrenophora seminiperda CCB06]|uniref:Uncharacterized protein n=1 Tax=Pyrenophora seminiperda CCB06 TaxID=1302712 RepID=A0A3M7MFH1_9PLEO|nr:hypothetical protein GMOD_00009646 [Pyrenophora seminiperda CCB06]
MTMFNPFRRIGRFLRSRSKSPARESTAKPEAVEETEPAVGETTPAASTPAPKAPNTTTGKLPASASASPASASESSTSQRYSNPATAGEDYRAAFNYALPPRAYVRPVLPPFKPSTFGIPAKQTKSTFDSATSPARPMNDIPPPSVPLWSPDDECDDEDMDEEPYEYHPDPSDDFDDLCASEMGSLPSSPSMTPSDEGDLPEPEAWSAEDNEGHETAQADEEMPQAEPASTSSAQQGEPEDRPAEEEKECDDTPQNDTPVSQSEPASTTPPQESGAPESEDECHDTAQADEEVPKPNPATTTRPQQCGTPESQDGFTAESDSNDGATTPDTETSSTPPTPPTPTPTTQNNRPTLSPRHPLPKYKKNWVDEIIQETSKPDDLLPDNYTGTFRGIRYYREDWTTGFECGYQNHHRLLCGHYVASREPCGRNCKDAILETAPFQCPTCQDMIDDLLDNKISTDEQEQLKKLFVMDKALVTMRCIELATRGLPQIKAGIADTVAAGILEGYARKAPTSNGPPVVDSVPLRVIIAERQAYWEKGQKRRMEEDMAAMAAQAEAERQEKKRTSGDEEHDEEAATKFQKTKLQGFPEPITKDTKGTKRTPVDVDDDEEEPATKFQKTKFQGFPEPITSDTRGRKRTSGDEASAGAKKQKVKFSASPDPITEETRGRKRTSSRHPLPSTQSGKKMKTGQTSSAPCMALVKGVKRAYEAEAGEASEEMAVKRGKWWL